MKYSLRTTFFFTGFACLWMAALSTQLPLLLELISLATLLVLLVAVPLCCFDRRTRRPFWAGFAGAGLGLLITSQFITLPINETINLLASLLMGFPENDNSGSLEPVSTPVYLFGQSLLYLLSFIFALLGGLIVLFAAQQSSKEIAG